METLQSTPVTAQHIRQSTNNDPLLSKVRTLVLEGWADGEDKQMTPLNRRSSELSVQDGCILWGSRVIIPASTSITTVTRRPSWSITNEKHCQEHRLVAGYRW